MDDDPGIRTLIEALLTRNAIAFDAVDDGEQAIDVLRKRSYGAIVLDLMLPKVNGFEVLKFLKAVQPANMEKVIVLTAASDLTLRDFHYVGSVGALVRKPFDITDFITLLTARLSPQISIGEVAH